MTLLNTYNIVPSNGLPTTHPWAVPFLPWWVGMAMKLQVVPDILGIILKGCTASRVSCFRVVNPLKVIATNQGNLTAV